MSPEVAPRRIQPVEGYLRGDRRLGADPAAGLESRLAFLVEWVENHPGEFASQPLFGAILQGVCTALGADAVAFSFRSGSTATVGRDRIGAFQIPELLERVHEGDELARVTLHDGATVVGAIATDTWWQNAGDSWAVSLVVFTPALVGGLVEAVRAACGALAEVAPAVRGARRPGWREAEPVLLVSGRFYAVSLVVVIAAFLIRGGILRHGDPWRIAAAVTVAALAELPLRALAARWRRLA